ncbi:MAG: hypothetical protein IJX17_08270 [Clostridia bacterium]|nr:hypothetical protein [Clostridia bacterium]
MTSLQDLDTIVPDIIRRLNKIYSKLTKYKKINTDYRAKTLMNEITAKINQIKKVHEAYKNTPSYKNKDFTNWVNMQENYVNECNKICDKIFEYESVMGYN